ncbi:glycosyltransferase [Candidatus Woesearchaeota archaeon]|nr:glycosyltransferase [Candidatus Woesearchaeota archaeon]
MKTDIIFPVYNEEHNLEKGVIKLLNFLKKQNVNFDYRIIIADNASTDKTLKKAKKLAKKYKEVKFIHLDKKGRGRALRKSWMESSADIVCYMDIDLSTELGAFPKCINALEKGYDIAIGNRLNRKSKVIDRTLKREILSRGYNLLLKIIFNTRIDDAQCGFKSLKTNVSKKLVPKIKNNEWFFDTELLLLAERQGYKIKQIPIKWKDDPDTRVNIIETVWSYIKNIYRMKIK